MADNRRDQYVEQLKSKLDEWNAELARLEAEGERTQAQLSKGLEEQLVEARKRRDEAWEWLQKLQKANESAWDDMVKGTEQAWDAFSDALKNARNRFNQ
ncbi:hypothetical protein H0Z60_03510 [Ectothiorhodospiraceae bacterium WFHF3C12]|nr:hypothetical protein [Ectothiorhodospiraceae bacterium WFHF3C12]